MAELGPDGVARTMLGLSLKFGGRMSVSMLALAIVACAIVAYPVGNQCVPLRFSCSSDTQLVLFAASINTDNRAGLVSRMGEPSRRCPLLYGRSV